MMPRLPVDPVDEIRALHDEIEAALRTSIPKAIRAGQLLTEVQAGLVHGQWEKWFAANLADKFSIRTARHYMAAYRNREMLKTATVAVLTELYAGKRKRIEKGKPKPKGKPTPDVREVTLTLSEQQEKDFNAVIGRLMAELHTKDVTTTVLRALALALANARAA